MVMAMNYWNVALAAVITFGICGMIGWVALLVYFDSQNMEIKLPSLKLWGKGREVGQKRLDIELLELKQRETEMKFKLTQQGMLADDLDHERLKRALGRGSDVEE